MAGLGGEMPVSDHDMDKPFGVWLHGFGTWGDLSSDGNAGGGNFTDSGMSGGLEYQLNRKVLIGFAGGYSSSDFSGDRWASGKADNIQFAGYGNYSSGNWYVDGVFSFGFLSTETQRHIDVGSIQQKAKGNYDGMVFSMSAEGGYAFHLGKVVDLQPFVGLNYTSLSQDGFNETGAGGNGLKVSSVEMDSLQGSLGLRLVANIEFKNGMKLTPQLHAVFEHEFMDTGAEVTSSFIGGSPSQVTRGVQLGEETGVVGANINFAFCKAVSAFVGYDVRLNDKLTSQNVSGGVTFSW
jgi:outer membrane autotransporter protein